MELFVYVAGLVGFCYVVLRICVARKLQDVNQLLLERGRSAWVTFDTIIAETRISKAKAAHHLFALYENGVITATTDEGTAAYRALKGHVIREQVKIDEISVKKMPYCKFRIFNEAQVAIKYRGIKG